MAKGRRRGKPVKAAAHTQPTRKFRASDNVAPARSSAKRKQPVKHAIQHRRRLAGPAVKHGTVQATS